MVTRNQSQGGRDDPKLFCRLHTCAYSAAIREHTDCDGAANRQAEQNCSQEEIKSSCRNDLQSPSALAKRLGALSMIRTPDQVKNANTTNQEARAGK